MVRRDYNIVIDILLCRLRHILINNQYISFFFFFNDTATTEIYPLPLHDALPISPTAPERQLMDDVRQRVRLWSATRPFYTDERHGPGKSAQSRGTEAVLSALMLAWDDARSARLGADTRAALDNMWAVQQASGPDRGAWAWLDFNLAPWEVPDAQYYGAALAALAVGVATADYRSVPQIPDRLQSLRA